MSAIQPLRIQKNTPSPSKMTGTPTHRPLAEIGPSERRRNSPSYNQATRKPVLQNESSPFDSSPFTNSPLLYWQSREPGSPTRNNSENQDPRGHSLSPAKRSSIENLKRASRVKNSNMFAREQKNEYDPALSPMIERPLASGRPLNAQHQGHNFGEQGVTAGRQENGAANGNALRSPTKAAGRASMPNPTSLPTKGQNSPTKSSLSSKNGYAQAHAFDLESSIWSDEEGSITERQLPPGKSLHRHAKSVTFDVAPPQVNEYEMTTPDPSSVASGSRDGSHDSTEDEDESFDRGSSIDHEDSFDASLEDIEKTPVVLPEDWRFMSPELANEELTAKFEDPFDANRNSPVPTVQPSMACDARLSPTRTESADSSSDRRPLPPLPANGALQVSHGRSDSKDSLSATADRVNHAQRPGASPPRPASVSKSEIQGMGGCSMSLEERLKLIKLDHESKEISPADEQRERRLRRGSPVRSPKSQDSQQANDNEVDEGGDDLADLGEYQLPPRISRESILRNVRARATESTAKEDHSSFIPSQRFSTDMVNVDPDVPLPSTEASDETQPQIKREPDEGSEVDIYAIPELYNEQLESESFMNALEKLEAIQKSQEAEQPKSPVSPTDDDDESHYSLDTKADASGADEGVTDETEEGPPTPRATAPATEQWQLDRKNSHRMSLPQFAALLGDEDFDFGMESFMSEAQPVPAEPLKKRVAYTPSWTPPQKEEFVAATELQRSVTGDAQLDPPRFPAQGRDSFDDPGTPESVVRHPVSTSPSPESPGIPEPAATIKSSSGKLKTRQSATPADIQGMAEIRRQVSDEVPAIPRIPTQHLGNGPTAAEGDRNSLENGIEARHSNNNTEDPNQQKRKSSLTPLDLRVEKEDGFDIESEFDRLLEAQKVEYPSSNIDCKSPWSPRRAEYAGGQGYGALKEHGANGSSRTQKGYLMRQNTKVIVASSASHESASDEKDEEVAAARGTRSAGNSPRKPSQQAWTAEPWNGKVRRKSIRKSGGVPSKPVSGPAPPLPGQQSNVASGLDIVAENEAVDTAEEIGEDGERGRLFVKVLRVKDLDLPLPRGERSYFALTLDNGLHCVTTSWLELGKTAPIGQEFELVVLNDLEFQLTLQTKIEEPKPAPVLESPTKAAKAAKSSAFSRVFASPRKRKEMELRQHEEAQRADRQRQQDMQASRRPAQPTAWELLHNLVAQDGSFARAYVCLKDHESSAYGKSFTVDVPCFNEWATQEAHNGSSARSKRTGGILRKPPYRVGKLELQMFYVPKPKGANDEEMPKSMNGCIRELKEAQQVGPTKWEGYLSQQGGDCPYWRRRFFSLDGSKFTAYHESTRQPRATINLAKASKLIDDKSALMRSGKGNRRKSAFAEDEEGYMFVEEGFRIRFGNGETIDFYADSAADKDGWMKALSEVVGKDMKNKKWTDLVLERHRTIASRTQQAIDGKTKPPPSPRKPSPENYPAPMRSAPPTPAKNFAPRQNHFAVPEKSPRRSDVAIANRRAEAASKTRSMIF